MINYNLCYAIFTNRVSFYVLPVDAGSEMVYGYLITDRPFIPDNFLINGPLAQHQDDVRLILDVLM
jgi:hypothetical protein